MSLANELTRPRSNVIYIDYSREPSDQPRGA